MPLTISSFRSSWMLPWGAKYLTRLYTLLANIQVELVGSIPGMFLMPSRVTPYFTAVPPAGVKTQLPPWSMEISTITEPDFMDFTISSVMSWGAILLGTKALQKTISISGRILARTSRS